VIVSLVSGLRIDEVIELLLNRYNVTQAEAENLIAKAKEKIVLASNGSQREQLGLAIRQLEDLYKKAIQRENFKLALDTRKELNRLYNLYDSADLSIVSETVQTATEQRTREYLEPLAVGLGYAEENLPLEELARLTSAYICNTLIDKQE
jgi:hypothetical protein